MHRGNDSSSKIGISLMGCRVQRGFPNWPYIASMFHPNSITHQVPPIGRPSPTISPYMSHAIDTSKHNSVTRSALCNIAGKATSSTTTLKASSVAYGQASIKLSESLARCKISSAGTAIIKTESSDNRLLSNYVWRSPGLPTSLHGYIADDSGEEIYSRKLFIGGLPIDITEEEIKAVFNQFGPVFVDWPRRPETDIGKRMHQGRMPGYVFVVFENEHSVRLLLEYCHKEASQYYLFVSSPTMRDKPVQVRPWRITDMTYMLQEKIPLNPKFTVFIGGVPRPTRAVTLAAALSELFGTVLHVGVDIDPELKYPKGAARVTFANTESYFWAIKARFFTLEHGNVVKRLEIKPYVMDECDCDECYGGNCDGRYALLFCADRSCLQYYCQSCWDIIHAKENKLQDHSPISCSADQNRDQSSVLVYANKAAKIRFSNTA